MSFVFLFYTRLTENAARKSVSNTRLNSSLDYNDGVRDRWRANADQNLIQAEGVATDQPRGSQRTEGRTWIVPDTLAHDHTVSTKLSHLIKAFCT